jgi:hypothetical protein
MKRFFKAFAVVAAAAFFQGTAQAVPLPPGGTVSLPTAVESGMLVGYMSIPFTFGSPSSATRIVGRFNEAVYLEAGGTYDFAYQVSVTANGSHGNVANFSVADFTNVLTNVASTNGGPNGLMPFPLGNNALNTASRSADGSTLTFVPTSPLRANSTSYVALVRTDATSFDQFGSVTFTNSSTGGSFGISGTFEPIAPPVPEPVTLVLWGGSFAGLACIGALRRRRSPVVQA